MSGDENQPIMEPLEREAFSWIVRLTSGDATDADGCALQAWRNLSPAHEEAFRSAARLWKHAGQAAAMPANARAAIGPGNIPERLVNRRTLLRGGALAASVVGIAIVGSHLQLWPNLDEALADYRTAAGERTRIALADGSEVELNSRSSIAVRFTQTERRIHLISGEAVFTVMIDPDRPFVVEADEGTTRAVGTVFAVRREEDQVGVLCLEGEVEVSKASAVRLHVGQRVTYGALGVGPIVNLDAADQLVSWRRGYVVFRDDPLSHVIDELNRYRPGRILLVNRDAARRRISGIVHLDHPDDILMHIQNSMGLRATHLIGGIILLR